MNIEPLFEYLPDHWEYTTLGDACVRGGGDVQTGPFGSQLHASDYVADGIPSIMPQNIGDNHVIADGIARITVRDAERLDRYRVRTGDIVYSRRGDVERRALIRERENGWLCGTGCLRVRFGDGEVNPTYASYYLGDARVREWVVRHAHGATMPNLNTSILSALPFVIPPLDEQRAIAHILGTLDDKIELNRRMNATLEAMARAIFQSWFVNFDPVRAKAEGRDTGLPEEIAALFPDSFEESALGWIPSGWEVKSLDEIANYQNGLALQNYPAEEGEDFYHRLKIRELRQGFFDQQSERSSTDIREECVVYDGDIIFSWSGSLLIDVWTGGIGALNQHLFKVTSADYPAWLYYYWTKHHLDDFQRIAAGKATTMGHIQRHHLSQALTCVPSAALMPYLDTVFNPLIDAMVNARLQSRTLAELRDTLLPKLIAGEIRVGELS